MSCVLLVASTGQLAHGQGTAITYQGQLQANGGPANGAYNLTFTLYTTNTGGTPVAGPVTNNSVNVSNGLFTVTLDFGSAVWDGPNNWLQIAVETNGASAFTSLSPRQQLTPAPYAIFAESANATGLTGTIPAASLSGGYNSAVNFGNASNSFAGNGAGLTAVNAAALGGLTSTSFWQTSGNSGTSPTNGNFLGSLDFQPVEIHVAGIRGLRIEPDPRLQGLSPNLIGGFISNVVQQPNSGADFIGSGGYVSGPNTILSNTSGAFIGAGSANQIGPNLNDSFVGAGYGNSIASPDSVIAGGYYNNVQSNAPYSTIAGGTSGSIGSSYDSIGGGVENSIGTNSNSGTISGGSYNSIANNAPYSTIAGGYSDSIGGPYGSIGGGGENSIGTNSNSGTISGGFGNSIANNTFDSAIGGGSYHQIGSNSYYSTIAGGRYNFIMANATASAVGGGYENYIENNAAYATIPGGFENVAAGSNSFAAGNQAQANHNGAFVWADSSTNSSFSSTTSNQFNVRALGGVRFVTGGAGMSLDGASLTPSGNYLFAYNVGIQNASSPGIFQDANFTSAPTLSGWAYNGSSFTCPQSGLYLVQYTAEAYFTDSFSLRGALNEVEIPGSQSYASFPAIGASATTMVISKSFLVSITAGNSLSIQFTANSYNDRLQGGGYGNVQPCLSLTVTRIQ